VTIAIAGAPAILTSRDTPEQAARRGTVLVYHGFGGSKEAPRPLALAGAVADAGYLAVSIDAVGHGERRYPDWDVRFSDERWNEQEEATETDFLTVRRETAAEIPAIVDDLVARGWVFPDRLGITGGSLGGEMCFSGILREPRIRVAAPIIGSPQWTLPFPDSPHLHADRYFPVPILSQTAELDEHIPADWVRAFRDRLAPMYATAPERLSFIEYPGVGHGLTPELWEQAYANAAAWFKRWFPTGYPA
jgi:uncharacterized protein